MFFKIQCDFKVQTNIHIKQQHIKKQKRNMSIVSKYIKTQMV